MRLTNQVYGVSNDLIDTYIERPAVDEIFVKGQRDCKRINTSLFMEHQNKGRHLLLISI